MSNYWDNKRLMFCHTFPNGVFMPSAELLRLASWCAKNVSPQEYHIVDKVGGIDWEISRNNEGHWQLYLKDEQMLTWAILSCKVTPNIG